MTTDALAWFDERGLKQTTVAAMGFGATVALVAAIGFLLLQSGGSLEGSNPSITLQADSVDARNGNCCQRVRIHHETGTTIGLEHVELLVTFSAHDKRARLTDLPTSVLDQGDYTGHHVFSLGDIGVGGAADADSAGDGRFAAGDTIEFRIEPKRLDLRPGETVVVTVFNGTSGTRLGQANASVQGN